MRAQVNGVVSPVRDPHHGEPGTVADDELDIVGVGSTTPVVDHHDGFTQLLDPDLQVPVGNRAFTRPGDGDVHRLAQLGVSPDGDQRCRVER